MCASIYFLAYLRLYPPVRYACVSRTVVFLVHTEALQKSVIHASLLRLRGEWRKREQDRACRPPAPIPEPDIWQSVRASAVGVYIGKRGGAPPQKVTYGTW